MLEETFQAAYREEDTEFACRYHGGVAPVETAMTARRPTEETARLGDAMYERDIRARVEDDHHGEYVAIDVDSGCWSSGGELLEAAERRRA